VSRVSGGKRGRGSWDQGVRGGAWGVTGQKHYGPRMNTDKTEKLFKNLDKMGLDDAVIGGQQAEAVNAGGGDYRAVGGISQGSQRGEFQGHFVGQR